MRAKITTESNAEGKAESLIITMEPETSDDICGIETLLGDIEEGKNIGLYWYAQRWNGGFKLQMDAKIVH